MVLMGVDLPLPAIRSQIASGIDIFVHLGRLRDKSRKVLSITEVDRFTEGEIRLQELYRFVEDGETQKKVSGKLVQVGELLHTEKLQRAGLWRKDRL